mmetsp:Transcript_18008/g.27220  ORF Transcript_18008/g.27220 Transcript_18008/m.27220 type:complete len:492 (+) Transcript_18008:323-1798(+)
MSTYENMSQEEDSNEDLQEDNQDQQMDDDDGGKNEADEKQDEEGELDGNEAEVSGGDDGKVIDEIENKEDDDKTDAAADDEDNVAEDDGKNEDEKTEENEEDKKDEIREDGDNVGEEKRNLENVELEKENEKENLLVSVKRSLDDGEEGPEEFIQPPLVPLDPEIIKQQEMIDNTPRTTELEHALYDVLKRKESQVDRLSGEISKLKAFISKRKQTYKRKRKDEGAPTRALSAYNIFVQDRFSKLAKENEQALASSDSDAQLKRVPPASLVASTGNQWKELSAEDKSLYEDRARQDRKRYEEQMAKYQPPDKQANRKRNKTGYNMFFSAHVLRLKQSEAGVPSERGSVARLVGSAWKQLSAEDKQYYEREADKINGMNPVDKDDDEEEGEEKRPSIPEYQPNYPVQHGDMHMHAGMPPPIHGHAQHPGQHDPRQHGHYYPPNYAYGQPPYHGYHDQAAQGQHRHYQGRGGHAHYQYPPPHGHPYDQRGMGM